MGRVPNSSAACTCCSESQLRRGPWTAEEDGLLLRHMKTHGDRGNWRKVPKVAGLLRCGKSCRLRWLNYLRPDLKRGGFSEDEDELIITLHSLLGNRWSLIAGRIPGRSDNEIKNYWNFHLGKKLLKSGINPKTHKPLSTSPVTELGQEIRTSSFCHSSSFSSISSSITSCDEDAPLPNHHQRVFINGDEPDLKTVKVEAEQISASGDDVSCFESALQAFEFENQMIMYDEEGIWHHQLTTSSTTTSAYTCVEEAGHVPYVDKSPHMYFW